MVAALDTVASNISKKKRS